MLIRSLFVTCTLLLVTPLTPQVSATSTTSSPSIKASGDLDLYLDDMRDYGSGEGPEVEDPTHIDHEGSGHGVPTSGKPYGAVYDYDTEDDYDDDYPEDDLDMEVIVEGSGYDTGGSWSPGRQCSEVQCSSSPHTTARVFIDVEDDDPYKEPEIIVKERPKSEDLPPAPPAPASTPPPTRKDTSGSRDMESPVQIHTTMTDERQVSIFAQPGILAAFIGGAVVGLLCAILLVMFIVYRMRKKDEGSYPLDEPKRMPLTSSYSPNDKEIYA